MPQLKNSPHAPLAAQGPLPPKGAAFSSWGGPAMKNGPHAPLAAQGPLPPEGAAFHLGAARR